MVSLIHPTFTRSWPVMLYFLTGCTTPSLETTTPSEVSAFITQPAVEQKWHSPLLRASDRVTKKSFGLYVRPGASPVAPERFTGYHTGVDFEVLPYEDIVPITSVCSGTLIRKQWVKGYGGVVVQQCTTPETDDVTVLYGHLDLSSVTHAIGSVLKEGESLGVLGKQGEATDEERMHLHLAVHRGTRTELRGYVLEEQQLDAWIDPLLLIKK